MLGHKRIPSREGGVEIVVETLATKMVKRGHDVTVYNRKGRHVSTGEKIKGQHKYEGVNIISIPTFERKSLNAIVYSFFATIRACMGHFDVIHFHAEGCCAMLWLPHLLHIKTVATIHGLDWQRAKWGTFATKFLHFSEKCAVKYADELIVLSEGTKQYFRDTYQRETIFIPNGIDKPNICKADLITKKYGLTKNSYILFVARLVPEKGAHYLVEAYKHLKEEASTRNKKLVIVGGRSHSGDYLDKLNKEIGVEADIIQTGFIEGRELEELYSNSYIYVLPSDIEGMPLSLLEAMSYGNCCLVSNIPENVTVTEEHALSFEAGNTEDLQQNLKKLLADEEKVRFYKEQASDYICNKYKWDDIVDRTLMLYKSKDK